METKQSVFSAAEADFADEPFIYLVEPEEAVTRVDIFLARRHSSISRTHVQKLIAEGLVTVNGQSVKANYKLRAGDQVEFILPPPVELEVLPEPIPLDVLYEDADVIVVNKPQGMVVHPAHGNYHGTLVNALLAHCRDLSGINGVLRPGIVHRLDKDTSGVLVVAKNDQAYQNLAEQIKAHEVTRRYVALVHGVMREPAGEIEAPIGRDPHDRKRMAVVNQGGKEAITGYRVLERFQDYTLIEARLKTGRTHQIRVHMAFLGHPVVGDPVYGPRKAHFGLRGQALHAEVLGFKHPRTGEYLEFTAPLPAYFSELLKRLREKRCE
ncbi:MAG: RluA family pseudouridine synthase [Firmicutes bacterium]|nr:RluA family pseudouridine synthase [Bacillota bacterium]